jgi:hypothetical protein
MENNVPNLDAMTADDLMAFWMKHQAGRAALELFPAGGRGTRSTTAALANYASNKATAMQCRVRGDIQTALMYEGIADRIYAGLPKGSRW